MSLSSQDATNIDLKREVVILSLIDYLGENKMALIKQYCVSDLTDIYKVVLLHITTHHLVLNTSMGNTIF